MGSLFKSPKPPAPVVLPAPAAPPPPPAPAPTQPTVAQPQNVVVQQPTGPVQESDPNVLKAREEERLRRLRAGKSNNTLVTGGDGLLGAPATGTKKLMGE